MFRYLLCFVEAGLSQSLWLWSGLSELGWAVIHIVTHCLSKDAKLTINLSKLLGSLESFLVLFSLNLLFFCLSESEMLSLFKLAEFKPSGIGTKEAQDGK